MVLGPMKKRMLVAGIIGFLIMLLLAIVAGVFAYREYAKLKDEKEILEKDYVQICFLSREIKAGTEITSSDLKLGKINKTAMPIDSYTVPDIGTEKIYAKCDMMENTILLKSMVYEEEKVTDDMRLQEFNMILLPSLLKENSYIDVRLLLPTGNDYVVISRKKVAKATDKTIWLNLNELDMQYISCAVIESYLTTGSVLYAIEYTDAPNQKEAVVTYPILPVVQALIRENPNLTDAIQVKDLADRMSRYENDRRILDERVGEFKVANEQIKEVLTERVLEKVQNQQAERLSQAQAQITDDGTYVE